MIITPEQLDSLKEAAKPLVKWLNENCHPHCNAVVAPDGVELLEGVASYPIHEFIKD